MGFDLGQVGTTQVLDKAIVTPLGAPRIHDVPIFGIILSAIAQKGHSVTTLLSTCCLTVDATLVLLEIAVGLEVDVARTAFHESFHDRVLSNIFLTSTPETRVVPVGI